MGVSLAGNMGKHYDQSERARTTNTGPLPRFIGLIPTDKGPEGVLVFSSITEMLGAIFLIFCKLVRSIKFEPVEVKFEPTGDLSGVIGWPDYETVLDGGEIEWNNLKYSAASLRPDERERLEVFDAHCRISGRRHRILYRDELERDGFIATISLLWRYGRLSFPEADRAGALGVLGGLPPTHLEGWQARAREALIPVDLLYHLLYHEQLPLVYRPLLPPALRLCRE
jgi:hypothetical protein